VAYESFDQVSMLAGRRPLSVSIIDPTLTPEQIKAIPKKDQLITILEYAKKNFAGLMPYVVKTCLYVTDLSQFKELNAVYVASFGLKPPARVCVEIPGDEVIAAFSFWNPEQGGEFTKIQENIHV
jgi:hypothetical protein